MFDTIISFSIRNKLVIGLGVVALVIWGVVSLRNLPIDAVPDITNNQVQVVTLSPALAPQEVERLITMPVELTMASIPGITEIRSISRFGLSVVTIVFHDDVDVYWARAQVDQRLIDVQQQIPAGAGTPQMAPVTTGLGEIYQYTLRVKQGYESRYTSMELRTVQDWIIRRRLLGTEGVADVSSFGGYLRQVEVAVDPERLRTMGLTMADLLSSVERNNANAGGAYIEKGPSLYYIRTEGMATTPEELGATIVRRTDGGLPVLLRDVATVRDGHAVRYGAMTIDAKGEAVGGIVLMLKGANSSSVIESVKQRIDDIGRMLPDGIEIEPFLDRTKLVNKAITTVSTNLIEGALIVIFVLVLLLGNIRAGLIVASVIPLAMLFAIGLMQVFGVSGNLMSLGAIDFGLIVDGAVIIVENVLHHLQRFRPGDPSRPSNTERESVVERASIQIRKSAAYGEIIIMMVYLPLLALVGIEGKMFKPMAQTVMFAIIGALILSTTYVPMMSALLLRNVKPHGATVSDRIMAVFHRIYDPIRHAALRRKSFVLITTLILFSASMYAFLSMGGEFIPQLDEGDFAVETRLMTGSSLNATVDASLRAADILKRRFPEVITVVGKVGTSEIPLDPMPVEACDLIIVLKDKKEWTTAHDRESLARAMQDALAELPGVTFGFQQPIQMRFNELMTGARQDVVIKVFGDDMDSLAALANRIGAIAHRVQGAEDVYVEPVGGLPQAVVRIDRDACARMNVMVDDVNRTVRAAFAGEPAGVMYDQEKRFDIVVRLDSNLRKTPEDLSRLTVPTATGTLVPIAQVASVDIIVGPNQIQREDTRRRIVVGFNVRGRDVESIVTELRGKVENQLRMPAGYYVTYGGQFENLAAAKQRLSIAVPAALLLILLLLYATFRSLKYSLLIFTAIPLSAIGGIAALLIRGMPFSISAGIGFIALFGVAVLNGIVLIAAFTALHDSGYRNIHRIVLTGTDQRLRPVVMTALVASLGFLPMALSTGDGAEVQRPLATVVIGGLITSTMLTLLVLPVLYTVLERRRFEGERKLIVPMIICILLLAGTTSMAQPRKVALDEAMRMARTSNINVKAARSNVAQREALRGAAVDLGKTSVTYMGGQYNSVNSDNNITIAQTIPFPLAWSANASLADARVLEAQALTVRTEREVDAALQRIFIRLAFLRTMTALIEEQRSLLQRTVEITTLRERTGEGTRLARITAESQSAELDVQLQQTTTDIRTAEIELQQLCGTMTPITTDQDSLVALALPVDTAVGASLLALSQRSVDVANEVVRTESVQYWPDITLEYFNQSLIGTQTVNGRDVNYTIGDRFQGFAVGLHLPLWFMPVKARTEHAVLQHEQAKEQERWQRMAFQQRLTQLTLDIAAARRTLDYYDGKGRTEAATIVDNAQRAFEAGEISALEHQQALIRALAIRTAALQALMRYDLLIVEHRLITTP
ncbi:MAG: CusA/CzcA family heavy metal efflux RND transporter ['Candidatus Kapabacteria' thiocyanatum]|uniref:Acriflavine resistance protein B n=1 Tax=Candidatus Kapaibacterium thiocyanatum TaxID=1895771 RepID=A0A1M3L6J1_9BACT|nr:CusA/CzcA family heavy metal efflux RND transporter ['Candidatus Kapabacteria' thiocyanatum]OJX61185.1 MAG: acriflavine resistance protein B ['Candidatus Kapabacteria' thiocyanatum]